MARSTEGVCAECLGPARLRVRCIAGAIRINKHPRRPRERPGAAQITNDGPSLNPIWGPDGIAFDHERLRRHAEPAYRVWLMASDRSVRRAITALAVPPLREGLVPIGFSRHGHRLLAEYEGLDTNEAWLLTLPGGHATPLSADLTGAALSHEGTSALVDRGALLKSDSAGMVESLPLAGGRPRVLAVHASEPSWHA
jgi:hypothetical protein